MRGKNSEVIVCLKNFCLFLCWQ